MINPNAPFPFGAFPRDGGRSRGWKEIVDDWKKPALFAEGGNAGGNSAFSAFKRNLFNQ